MTLRAACALAALLAAVTPVGAFSSSEVQQPASAPLPSQARVTPPEPTALVVGQVIDALTEKPVPDAVVAIAPGAGGLLSPNTRRALTDGRGRFMFERLAKGAYSFTATVPGYTVGRYRQLRPRGRSEELALNDGERVVDARLLVWPLGAITGQVTDEAGDPLVRVQVNALRRTAIAGRPGFADAGGAQTDDRGMYRISGLETGDYVIAVPSVSTTMPATMLADYFIGAGEQRRVISTEVLSVANSVSSPGSPANQVVGNMVLQVGTRAATSPPMAGDRLGVYTTRFYPGVTAIKDASPIVIAPGDARSGADIRLESQPSVRVSGVVTVPAGAAGPTAMTLVRADAMSQPDLRGYEVAVTIADVDGSFTFLGVPPGDYMIRVLRVPPAPPTPSQSVVVQLADGSTASRGVVAGESGGPSAPTYWAMQPISVGDRDLTDVQVALARGVRVSGRIAMDTTSERAPGSMRRSTIYLDSPAQWITARTAEASVDADGNFSTYEVPPGRYRLAFGVPAGLAAVSAIGGGQDLLNLPVDIKTDIADVVVTVTDKVARIQGTVRTPQGSAATDVEVFVFPVDPRQWVDYSAYSPHIKNTVVSKTGAYTLEGFPPGAYFVAALNAASVDWSRVDFLESLSRTARRIEITPAAQLTVDLTADVRR